MAEALHQLEESLKAFLNDIQSDNYNARNTNFHKYNNLKITMEPNQNKNPHFIIRIGISEAGYDIETCERLFGGLGSDERLIRRWFERTFIKAELNDAWSNTKKIKPVTMKEEVD